MPRPKKKAGEPVRRRINLSFDLNEKNEAIAYEILHRLSETRQATQYVVALMLAQSNPQPLNNAQETPALPDAPRPAAETVAPVAEKHEEPAPAAKPVSKEDAPGEAPPQAADEQTLASIFDIFGG